MGNNIFLEKSTMQTTISKKFQVQEPVEKVWEYLTDPNKIVNCVPGASLTEQIDDRNFKGGVSLKFGPVKAKYSGQITFEEIDEPNRKMTLKGRGLDSKGKGSADMLMNSALTEIDGGTEVDCSMQITIVGKLAQFGARLINDVSDQLFDQFVTNFQNKLAADAPAVVEEAAAVVEEAVASENTEATTVAAPPKVAPTPPPAAPAEDNSVNAFALMWAVIKGFFSRLFGGGK